MASSPLPTIPLQGAAPISSHPLVPIYPRLRSRCALHPPTACLRASGCLAEESRSWVGQHIPREESCHRSIGLTLGAIHLPPMPATTPPESAAHPPARTSPTPAVPLATPPQSPLPARNPRALRTPPEQTCSDHSDSPRSKPPRKTRAAFPRQSPPMAAHEIAAAPCPFP